MFEKFNKLIERAAKNIEMMNIIDLFESGVVPDEECSIPTRLRTVELALEAGLKKDDWNATAEAYVMLRAINKNINAENWTP